MEYLYNDCKYQLQRPSLSKFWLTNIGDLSKLDRVAYYNIVCRCHNVV